MRSVQVLSRLALQRILGSNLPGGDEEPGALESDLLSCTRHVARALRQANARAWAAVEILLAGEEFWERAQLFWERDLEIEFFQPIRFLLDTVSLGPVDRLGPDARLRARQSLEAALKSGLLTTGALELADLVPRLVSSDNGAAEPLAAEPLAEMPAILRLTADLEQAGYADLGALFELQCESDRSLLVFLVGEILRLAVEDDPDLFGAMAELFIDGNTAGVGAELRGVATALHRYVARVDTVLEDIRQTHPAPAITAAGAPPLASFGSGRSDCISNAELIHRGDSHRLQGSYAQALADYSQALRVDPSNSLALVQRGQVYWLMGQSQEAIADYSAALELDPKSAVACYYRGKALADSEDYDAAVVNFSEALRLDPHHAWAYHDLGDVYAAQKAYERAIANYCMAIRLNPLAALTYLRRGEATAALGEFERAIADLDNALRLDPHNAVAYMDRGTAFRELGRHEQAEADLSRALELDVTSAKAYYERGVLFQQQGNQERAVRDFDDALYHDPKNADAFCRRAQTFEALGKLDRAVEDLTQAVRLEPSRAAAYSSRGQVYMHKGELDLAQSDFSEAIQIEPTLAVARLNRAKILGRLGQLEEALADCHEAVRHEPQLAQAYLARGSILAQQREYTAAVDDFSQALRLEPLGAQTYFLRGVAQKKLANAPQAVADLTEAIRLDPRLDRAYLHRAVLRNKGGHLDLALEDLAHATRLDTQHAAVYCGQLGNLHAARGSYECAVADYTVALLLDPDNATVRAARDQALQSHEAKPRPTPSKRPAEPPVPVLVSESAVFRADVAPPAAAVDMPRAKMTAPAAETIDEKTGPSTPIPARAELVAAATSERSKKKPPAAALTEGPKTPVPLFTTDEPAQFTLSKGYNRGREELHDLIVNIEEDEKVKDDEETENETENETEDEALWRKEQDQIKRQDRAREAAQRASMAAERAKKLTEQKRSRMLSTLDAQIARARVEESDDDDDRMPLWKRSMLAAAGLFLFYLMGSAAWGFFVNRGSTSAPTTYPVTGQVVFANGQPLPGGFLRLHPKDPPSRECHARLDRDGTFKVSSFGKDDGAPPGRYIVTIDPPPKMDGAIPKQFLEPETSPWHIEVRSGTNTLDTYKLQ
ncbi:MAG: tetratricopeptide repeat protein [Planctomycetes bacterium]|nr:tetratricopeptide repeat protein [Planctomycetota bacterium]